MPISLTIGISTMLIAFAQFPHARSGRGSPLGPALLIVMSAHHHRSACDSHAAFQPQDFIQFIGFASHFPHRTIVDILIQLAFDIKRQQPGQECGRAKTRCATRSEAGLLIDIVIVLESYERFPHLPEVHCRFSRRAH
jgi:hypothetical protein